MARNEPDAPVRLRIGGLTDDRSVATVTRALENVPGVRKATVDLDDGVATLTLGAAVEPATLRGAVEGAGYDAEDDA